MRTRGQTYWEWVDAQLHCRTHTEVLDCGLSIDVQVRLSRVGTTQLFIGLYLLEGARVHEEAYSARPGQSMTTALLWGVARARELAAAQRLPGEADAVARRPTV
ncbi:MULTISPECIES: hypothetical protein [unclassified Pseudomonas]|uniref:hypothetical protein n=1 Tax=unclassified Pseudomonas TaxID=196821 RepID=UPI00244A1BE0|nr:MULTISPECIES: hypothetical protein [unclassified Pseudomonas]MDH0303322.1 hypothetical protein [Pseudomonas sp. GD04091]MDH1985346.1 hypothetical protein [Pseudomonas sp. GD03689]